MTALTSALNGVVILTAIYGLLSLGLVLIFRATRVLNFAAGAVGLMGAYFVYALQSALGFYLALLVGSVLALVAGGLLYRFVLAPISGARGNLGASTDIGVVLGTIVLAEALGALIPYIAGSGERKLSVPLPQWEWRAGSFMVSSLEIAGVLLMLVVVGAIALGMSRSRLGMAMRATADNPRLAGYFGVSPRRMATVSWALAAFVSTLGVVVFATSSALNPTTAAGLGAAIFPALLLGGLDSIIGCLVGSFVLALVQSSAAVYLGGGWTDVAPYAFLLIVLIVRPHGFFGHGEFSRL
ncbi:branched-chain amino acid ABC transporter permease [Saccharopolyspora phatthalungensis]|uniref:Branched-chain amino acid transport system permease protein n=1 Tax=Saccharopolyspora phatthalungensis TaxID=664693 RepID=A0A840QJ60_9PSEU|nr:branched-chain amino acid ABC transporter permease [Saccharopolyspora phatthalungensis]MBB5158919.1 branched-chain amino acid transport system permease protein [Saccharopolyspora phatthalungensis]